MKGQSLPYQVVVNLVVLFSVPFGRVQPVLTNSIRSHAKPSLQIVTYDWRPSIFMPRFRSHAKPPLQIVTPTAPSTLGKNETDSTLRKINYRIFLGYTNLAFHKAREGMARVLKDIPPFFATIIYFPLPPVLLLG